MQAHSTHSALRDGNLTPVCSGALLILCLLKLPSVPADVIVFPYSGGLAGIRDYAPSARWCTLSSPLSSLSLRPPAQRCLLFFTYDVFVFYSCWAQHTIKRPSSPRVRPHVHSWRPPPAVRFRAAQLQVPCRWCAPPGSFSPSRSASFTQTPYTHISAYRKHCAC